MKETDPLADEWGRIVSITCLSGDGHKFTFDIDREGVWPSVRVLEEAGNGLATKFELQPHPILYRGSGISEEEWKAEEQDAVRQQGITTDANGEVLPANERGRLVEVEVIGKDGTVDAHEFDEESPVWPSVRVLEEAENGVATEFEFHPDPVVRCRGSGVSEEEWKEETRERHMQDTALEYAELEQKLREAMRDE